MIKISALNDESEENSDSDDEITTEAQEQIALQQYSKALEHQRKGELQEALALLKDLLETELLDEVQKTSTDKGKDTLLNLKYLCYKNVAVIQSNLGDIEAAIESYCAAADLDDTDVMLWHKLGLLCCKDRRYDMALYSFQKGTECNPKHWPCIDRIVTLLLALSHYEDCIVVIHDALNLDPDYLRGLAYRKYIYTSLPYIRRYMEHLDSKYIVNEKNDVFDEVMGQKLIQEAENIKKVHLEKIESEKFPYVLPELKLQKPITQLSWLAVGTSLIDMHKYMTENCYSHASMLEINYTEPSLGETSIIDVPKEIELMECDNENGNNSTENASDVQISNENTDGPVNVDIENDNNKQNDVNVQESVVNGNSCKETTQTEQATANDSRDKKEDSSEKDNEKEQEDKEKVAEEPQSNEAEKMECDIETSVTDTPDMAMQSNDAKEQKKSVRRRGSDLSRLQQWEWCTKRRSGRKKPVTNNKEVSNDSIYDILRKMVPASLTPGATIKNNNERERSPDTTGLDKLFDEQSNVISTETSKYFETNMEEEDVSQFIKKFSKPTRDIIEIMKEYLFILSSKWDTKWPSGLPQVYIDANKLYNTHIELPSYSTETTDEYVKYIYVNLLSEELNVNALLEESNNRNSEYNLYTIQMINHEINTYQQAFEPKLILELVLRTNWIKLHAHILNNDNEMALDCLYLLTYEFQLMGEESSTFSLCIPNITFKSVINELEINKYIKFLERNKQLSTVPEMFELGNYEQVISILVDSFDYCKKMDKSQEEEMSIDLSFQMCMILESYWALGKVDDGFKWSITCLNESLKHYFRFTSGCSEYEKWSKVVVKILCSMEHMITTEGHNCLESVTQEELSQCLEDLIRIIGHQVETTATEMPLDTVSPWIIMHYILQREEDQGRGKIMEEDDKGLEEVPHPMMVLFIGHEHLGSRFWCSRNDAKLLYFILDTVVPRLRLPLLSKSLEQILQYMEQCVYCLYGHPGKRHRLKYLEDHNVTPHSFDWARAQQIYEIFRPLELPELHGKVPAITADTELLFQRILAQMPKDYDLQKYLPELERYMIGKESKIPPVNNPLPYKLRDIYFVIGDYHFKKDDHKLAVKYNMLDILLNNKRFESWAEVTLAKELIFERLLSCSNTANNEKEFLKTGRAIIRCFKLTLEIDFNCELATEYGRFAYYIHSFCSRLLKQASESLSMEDFEALEKQKDEMLNTTQKCFATVAEELKQCHDQDRVNEGMWLSYYMLGKVAEKRGQPPSVIIDYYKDSVRSLHEADAVYPYKINYNSPQHYSIQVLELHYRIHGSILKYIEQHENKPIPSSIGKIFLACIEGWKSGPFSKKEKKNAPETDQDPKQATTAVSTEANVPQHAANILKRSISDAGEEHENQEAKKQKLEAAKIRRSASYDMVRLNSSENVKNAELNMPHDGNTVKTIPENTELKNDVVTESVNGSATVPSDPAAKSMTNTDIECDQKKAEPTVSNVEKKESSSSSSSDTTSSDTSSDSHSSRDSDKTGSSSKSEPETYLTDDVIMNIITPCLEALEECVMRFPLHYKALYRLAHYYFYYKKGKNIERCRDIMLSNFLSRTGTKIGGLFGERKTTNLFNNIWRIPIEEIDRPGGFEYHMNRCILITQEILKEIDDYKSLLDIGLQLQRVPDPDKRYLRDSDREELAQQSLSLCVQSLKGQLMKFGQQADLKTNDVERRAFNSLMLDIYRAYQRAQKQPISKQFVNLLVDGFKLITNLPITDNMNLVDLSMKYCQSLRQQINVTGVEKIQGAPKKQSSKTIIVETSKAVTVTTQSVSMTTKPATVITSAPSQSSVPKVNPPEIAKSAPKMSQQDIAKALQSYLPSLTDPMMSSQAAAALSLSYLSNLSAYAALQNSIQSSMMQPSMQNSFQAEYYRQFLSQTLSHYNVQPPKKQQKRASNKVSSNKTVAQQLASLTASQLLGASSSKTATSKPNIPSAPVTSLSQLSGLSTSKANKTSHYSSLTSVPQSVSTLSKGSTAKSSLSATSIGLPGSLIQSTASKSFAGLSSTKQSSTSTSLSMTSASSLLPMGTVLQTLPPSLSATLTSSYSQSRQPMSTPLMTQTITPPPSSVSQAKSSVQQTSPSKTLQEKLAERQKQLPSAPKTSSFVPKDIVSPVSRLPSSLTITKTSTKNDSDKKLAQKKPIDPKQKRKPFLQVSDVIVLDDDDD